MKRVLLLVLALLILTTSALADTRIDGAKARNITLHEVGLNEAPEGVSPTTGRTLADIEVPEGSAGLAATGRYMPMLVQIDNAEGGMGYRAPWGARYADIVYESPLYLTSKSKHSVETRISFLFSDILPDDVGPVRSARMGHAWLREEWDCGFVFYGQQTYEGTNVLGVFKQTGADQKGVLFSGIVGSANEWKKFFYKREQLISPHDKGANIAAMSELIPAEHVAPNHAFLFTDEIPQGKPAKKINVSWNMNGYNSQLVYDAAKGTYTRSMLSNKGKDLGLYVDFDTKEPLEFNNVIIQHTVTNWKRVDAPVTQVVGEGNADYFIGGMRVPGYWKRADMSSRTVYYDLSGNEMAFARGRTLIVLLPLENTVSYAAE